MIIFIGLVDGIDENIERRFEKRNYKPQRNNLEQESLIPRNADPMMHPDGEGAQEEAEHDGLCDHHAGYD